MSKKCTTMTTAAGNVVAAGLGVDIQEVIGKAT